MTDKSPTIAAVVVTRNRKAMLADAIEAILAQTLAVCEIVVVDNASTDGTPAMMQALARDHSRISYFRLPENTGGAGGFNHGMKKACLGRPDFIWMMDDDVCPAPSALAHLVQAACDHDAPFYCSKVVGTDQAPMNLPEIDTRGSGNGYPDWTRHLEKGMVKVRTCTFVSILVPFASVQTAGYPIREMFIWGDDGEYTFRLSKKAGGLAVGSSLVEHRRENQKKIEIFNETRPERIRNFVYYYRNNLYLCRKYKARASWLLFIVYALMDSVKCLAAGNTAAFRVIISGIVRGLFFNPAVESCREESGG